MFGKRKPPQKPASAAKTTVKPIEREITRPVETAEVPAARPETQETPAPGSEGRKLVVGREICLTGEIKACEKLVVEGRVEADLTDSQFLEVAEPGYFKGNAVVNNCEISGVFEGELFVHGFLLVKATGRVNGSIYYGELKIERGGRVNGNMELIEVSGGAEIESAGLPPIPPGQAKIPRRVSPLNANEDKGDEAPGPDKGAPNLAGSGTG